MKLDSYTTLDATALAELVRRGEATPAALAEAALAAVEAVNGTLHAVVETYPERAAGAAPPGGAAPAGARSAGAPPAGAPFAGVPFLLKDFGAAEAGRPQTCGSRLLAGRVAREEAALARRFRQAGLVVLGRSAAPEFALSLSTESALYGDTCNPWDVTRLAGGSSGGAGAAVAAGIVPAAHGTDAAGSIRIPASACGVVGLKPSRGRVSHAPSAGEPLMGMDTEFVLTRTVRDTAALLDAVAGAEPGDPAPLPRPARRFVEELAPRPDPLRVAFTLDAWGGYEVEAEVAAATAAVARLLEAMGHRVEEASPRFDYDAFVDAAGVAWALGFDVLIDGLARDAKRAVGPDTLEPVTLRLLEGARSLTGADVARAEAVFNRIRRDVAAFFGRVDVLLTPTLLRLPEPLGRYSQSVEHPDFESFFRLCDEAGAFLPLFNLTGQPAVSLPLAWSASGLPIGMQFAARVGDEATLLRLASQLELARPWAGRRPPVHAGGAAAATSGAGPAAAAPRRNGSAGHGGGGTGMGTG